MSNVFGKCCSLIFLWFLQTRVMINTFLVYIVISSNAPMIDLGVWGTLHLLIIRNRQKYDCLLIPSVVTTELHEWRRMWSLSWLEHLSAVINQWFEGRESCCKISQMFTQIQFGSKNPNPWELQINKVSKFQSVVRCLICRRWPPALSYSRYCALMCSQTSSVIVPEQLPAFVRM